MKSKSIFCSSVTALLCFNLSPATLAGDAQDLFNRIMATTSSPWGNPEEIKSWVSPYSEKYNSECRMTISRESYTSNFSGKIKTTFFYLWFEGPTPLESSASSVVGNLQMDDSTLELVLTSPESFSIEMYYGNPWSGDGEISSAETVSVQIDGDTRFIEVRPLDEDTTFKAFNSSSYFNITIVSNKVIRVEKKHWRKQFFGGKKLSFHDICHF